MLSRNPGETLLVITRYEYPRVEVDRGGQWSWQQGLVIFVIGGMDFKSN